MSNYKNFNVYRCIDPRKQFTDTPWYPIENACPCNPNDINITGRGFTPCAYGVQYEDIIKTKMKPVDGIIPKGNLYQNNQNVPPQLQPRPLSRIGTDWRSAN